LPLCALRVNVFSGAYFQGSAKNLSKNSLLVQGCHL
jgi:hypothetical protein